MISFILNVIASVVGALLLFTYQRSKVWFVQKNLLKILDFLNRKLMFVYPPRRDQVANPSRVILPRTATEDFLSINNMLSVLLKLKWNGLCAFKNSEDFLKNIENKKNDIVFICSPFSNPGCNEALIELEKKEGGLPKFLIDDVTKRNYIRFHGNKYESTSYDVIEECIKNGSSPENAEMLDYAAIIKTSNPWEPDKRILILAGIRGVGTWGASEFIKKHWEKLYNKKRSDGKHTKRGNFAAIIKVLYKDCDLKEFSLEDFIDLD